MICQQHQPEEGDVMYIHCTAGAFSIEERHDGERLFQAWVVHREWHWLISFGAETGHLRRPMLDCRRCVLVGRSSTLSVRRHVISSSVQCVTQRPSLSQPIPPLTFKFVTPSPVIEAKVM